MNSCMERNQPTHLIVNRNDKFMQLLSLIPEGQCFTQRKAVDQPPEAAVPLFSLTTGSCRSALTMAAKVILTAKQNSIKFSDRELSLDNPAIIGKSGGQVPSGSDNAYFDSKVRNRRVFEEEKSKHSAAKAPR